MLISNSLSKLGSEDWAAGGWLNPCVERDGGWLSGWKTGDQTHRAGTGKPEVRGHGRSKVTELWCLTSLGPLTMTLGKGIAPLSSPPLPGVIYSLEGSGKQSLSASVSESLYIINIHGMASKCSDRLHRENIVIVLRYNRSESLAVGNGSVILSREGAVCKLINYNSIFQTF